MAPIFLFAIEFLEHKDGSGAGETLADMLPAGLIAIVVGAVVGAGAALCAKWSLASDNTTKQMLSAVVLAVPLLAYAAAVGLSANGFIAAFVAGLFFRSVYGPLEHSLLSLSEGVASFVAMPLWFIIGQLLVLAVDLGGHWQSAMLLAFLGLTVLRVVPIMVVLLFSRTSWAQRLLIGWLGPRGIASVVFMLLAFPAAATEERVRLLVQVLAFTVVGSVLLHGLSAPLIARQLERAGYVDEDALDDDGRPLHPTTRADGSTRATRYVRR